MFGRLIMEEHHKKRTSLPNVTGNHAMAWKELAEADDLASSLTVDAFLMFTTHKMTDMKLRIPERIRAKFRDSLISFRQHKCYATAYDQLTSDQNIVKRSWKMDPRFREHVYRYLLLFDDRSGVEIRACSRYASENHIGAAIFATKDWPKGSRINTLIGCIAELNHEEEAAFLRHRKNDFSVMYSSRKNCSQLWLGPAAYVNHDCQPNCEFTINCDADARMSLESKTDIRKGEEIFIYYGQHFFDSYNSACECFTCELLGRGFFSKLFTNAQLGTLDGASQAGPNDGRSPVQRSEALGLYQSDLSNKGDVERSVGRTNHCICRSISSSNITECSRELTHSLMLPDSGNGTLPKGSSAGFARLSMPTSYSLRHTGSRMNRVKARIRAAINATAASTPTQMALETIILNNADSTRRRTDRVKSRKIVRSNQSKRNVISQRVSSTPSAGKSSAPSLAFSSPQLEIDTFSDSFCPVRTLSPTPPHLDRVSSSDSLSMPSQLSTAASTPKQCNIYYQNDPCIVDNHSDLELMPRLKVDSEDSSNLCSSNTSLDLHISDHSSATSPACSVEPILVRLLDESRSSKRSNSSSPQPLFDSKRLTNYDARLIAEANLLPPGSVRRRRPVPGVWDIISTKRCKRSPTAHSRLRHLNRTKQRSPNGSLTGQHVVRRPRSRTSGISPRMGTVSSSAHKWDHRGLPIGIRNRSRGTRQLEPPVLSMMDGDISGLHSSLSSDAGADSDGTSEATSSTTPLRLDPVDSLSIPSPLSSSLETERSDQKSLTHIRTDHDYIKPSKPPQLFSFPSYPVSNAHRTHLTENPHFRTNVSHLPACEIRTSTTPPPPTLHPMTPHPVPDQPIPFLFQKLDECSIPHVPYTPLISAPPVALSRPHAPIYQSEQATRSLAALWSPIENGSGQRTVTVDPRLTVTLKRIGPKLYQISQPNRLFILR